MLSPVDKAAYAARQSARVAWYMGHYFASQRFHKAKDETDIRRHKPRSRGPSVEAMLGDMARLFERDLAIGSTSSSPTPVARVMSSARALNTGISYLLLVAASGYAPEIGRK